MILTTLHSGGKFDGKAYSTSGGLHGVGVSVVNALSSETMVEVARDKMLYRQRFARGLAAGPLETVGPAPNRRGTTVSFVPDAEIFGADARFDPARLYKLARSKAYLFAGVEIRWRCDPSLAVDDVPEAGRVPVPRRPRRPSRRAARGPRMRHRAAVHRPPGLSRTTRARAEWAVAWPVWSDGAESYYCNTIPTPDGGTHEAGLRAALTKGIRAFGELVGNKRAKDITADDVFNGVELMLSVFIRNPHFQSQTKDRLTSLEAARFVEAAVRDHFDHFLADNMDRGRALLGAIVERMEERLKRRAEREVKRKTATSRPQAAPARQAHRLRQRRRRGHRTVHRRGRQRRRLGQAGARPQDPGDPADPRQDPQRRLGHRRQDPRQQRDRRPRPGARLRHPRASSPRTRCATSGSSS